MGWTCFKRPAWRTPLDTIRAELTEDGPRGKWEVIDDHLEGGQYFAVMKRTYPDGRSYHFGMVCLIEQRGSEFCYKDMSEDMGPYAHKCPARILDALDRLAPDVQGYARDWRNRCRAHLAGQCA